MLSDPGTCVPARASERSISLITVNASRSFTPSVTTGQVALKQYYVYIMANRTRMLYTGVTNNLERRVYEHKHSITPGFTSKYNLNRLIYYEVYADIREAIAREKQIKRWLRAKKITLIESDNPKWEDLSAEWD